MSYFYQRNSGRVKRISNIESLKQTLESYIDVVNSNDDELINELINEIKGTIKKINLLELETKLSGKNDKKNAILEVHSGAGGTESCDWADMLLRMYLRWCDKKNFKYEILDTLPGEEAGVKKVIVLVKGLNAYGYLKCERGVHRLVRLSPFDSQNRRHTSFAAVEVIPEENDDINIEIKDSDIRVDVYRSSGAGGQGVNTTDSAVRITYLPTNTVVTCQNERSQLKNKEQAMKVLKSKIYEDLQKKQNAEIEDERRSKIGTGDRAEKIRTYNYPQNRVTDHRINLTIMQLDRIMQGKLDEIIEALINEDQRRKLAGEYLKKYYNGDINNAIKRLEMGEPVQYIVGNVDFFGYKINVDKRVLIPRYETEELVENTIKYIKKYFSLPVDILEVGTGSGCISITLKKELENVNITASDISSDALEVALSNAKENNADINFVNTDIYKGINKKFDCIISNPPYISKDEKIMDIVYNNEPHLALFADNNGLYFMKKY